MESDYVTCPPVIDRGDMLIERFAQRSLSCAHQARGADYASGISLLDRHARYDAASSAVDVLTWWHVADEAALEQYNISLQILSLDGQKASQMDRHLTHNLLPWRVLQLPTDGLSPGDYQLALIVYDRVSGAKLTARDHASGASEKFLPVARFTLDG